MMGGNGLAYFVLGQKQVAAVVNTIMNVLVPQDVHNL